jgi:hypothetical protein
MCDGIEQGQRELLIRLVGRLLTAAAVLFASAAPNLTAAEPGKCRESKTPLEEEEQPTHEKSDPCLSRHRLVRLRWALCTCAVLHQPAMLKHRAGRQLPPVPPGGKRLSDGFSPPLTC